MTKERNYLMILDFDNTIALTLKPSPNKIGVEEAYRSAIEELFGMSGLAAYEEIGGLQNMAPSELVKALLSVIETHQKPEKITEMIVEKKLSVLMKEIGTHFHDGSIWPEPCPGIVNFFKSISEANKKGGIHIDVAILSSGHRDFIKKTFRVWGQKCPKILVTDDDARRLPDYPTKPAKILLDLILKKWKNRGYPENGNIMYFGDDLRKDGQFAKNAGISFGWFNPNQHAIVPKVFQFSSWETVSRIVKDEIELLRDGKPISQIFKT